VTTQVTEGRERRATGAAVTGTAGDRFAGRGWAYPVGVAANGGIATVGGVANIEKAMRIVLATYLGERPMRPNFGSLLRDFVFAGVTEDNAKAIAAEVRRALFECEPRARVDHVAVDIAHGVDGRFDIEILFTVLETNSAHNLVVPFYAIPGEED
jgi:phage baseplate assembly protein W